MWSEEKEKSVLRFGSISDQLGCELDSVPLKYLFYEISE